VTSKTGRVLLYVLAPLFILVLPIAVYLVDQAVHSGTIPRNVSIAGVDVAGLKPDEALTVVKTYQDDLYADPAVFVVNGTPFELEPEQVDLSIDVETALSEAVAEADHGTFDGLFPWLKSFSEEIDIPVTVTVDGEAIDSYLERWEADAIDEPAFDGNIEIVDGAVVVEYPKAGLRIDRDAAHQLIEATLVSSDRTRTEIPLVDRPPAITDAELDAAAATVEDLISEPVTLTNDEYDYRYTMTADELASAVTIDIITEGNARVEVGLDPDAVAAVFEPHREDYEQPPVEVKIDTNVATNGVSVTMPENGTRVDTDELTEALEEAALGTNEGELPVVADVEPEITAEEVEAWGPLQLVSQFTTKHPAGQPRVTNIQLMADTVDGSIVWPGETFSINEKVGRRTEAKGYVRDGAIINGDVYCCDSPTNVGGGVSQFGTTFFNAVFFGGYEDIEHQPHSIYFSKYPEGREATLGYPHPDVVFRNNSDAPVIIRTAHTSTTITVKFFGNNGGLKVESERSERRNFTDPIVIYEENPSLSPGVEKVVKRGSQGWTVTVTRVITYPDGTVVREPFTWRYRGNPRKIQVASCDTVSGSARCSTPPSTTPPTTRPPTTAPPTTGTTQPPPPDTTQPTTPPTTGTTQPPPPDTTQPTTPPTTGTTDPAPPESTTTSTAADSGG